MIHQRVSDEKLALVRIILFACLAVYASSVPVERLALLDSRLLHPVGVAALFPLDWLSSSALLTLRISAAACLALAATGIRPFRMWAILGMVFFTLFVSVLHPGHRELGAMYLGYALTVGPSATTWTLGGHSAPRDEVSKTQASLTLQVATFVFLLTYSVIGVHRLLHGAPNVFMDGSIVWHVAANSERNGAFQFAFGYAWLSLGSAAVKVLECGFLIATIFEAAAPLALFFRSFRRIFVCFAIGFHVINLLFLNIEFSLNIVVVSLLLIEWDPAARTQSHAEDTQHEQMTLGAN